MLRQLAISCIVVLLVLPVTARTRPHYGGVLRVETEGDPWQRQDGLARQLVFDGLTRIESDGATSPSLAVQWASENDNHRWEFHLRPGVNFQDGSPLTSVAVAASLNAACAGHCPWTTLHAIGSSVIFTSDSAMPNLPALLAGSEYFIAGGTDGNIGTGPFQFKDFNNGVLNLTANDSCWRGRPFLDAIEIQAHRNFRDQWLDLSLGRADLVEVPAEELRQAHELHLNLLESQPVSLLALNISNTGILGNPDLRAAIALAMDREALSNVIFQKQGEVTASLLPNTLTGYSFLFPITRDLNQAHAKRGGLNLPPLAMTVEGSGAMQLAAQRIALNLGDAGFNVQVVAPGGPRPADLTLRRLALNAGEPSAALEEILRAAGVQTPVNEETPSGLFRIEKEFLDTHTLVPLLYLPRAYAISARVRDLRLSADGIPLLSAASLEDAP